MGNEKQAPRKPKARVVAREWCLYVGKTHVGYVECSGDDDAIEYEASDVSDNHLATYPSRAAAVRAVVKAWKGGR